MTVADRIAVMDHGKVVQVATPAEIYEQPRTRFIAEFVGDVNILEGKVAGRDNGLWRIASPSAAAPLVVDHPDEGLETGQGVALAIRPEKMTLQRQPSAAGENILAGEVWDIGYLGDWTIYRVKLDSGAMVRVSCANVSRFVDAPVSWEDRVYLSFAPQSAVILTR
jgi:putrescine transport system ATP-binding protein